VRAKIFHRVYLKHFESRQIYKLKTSLKFFVIHTNPHRSTTYRHQNMFTVIPNSLLEVLLPVLLGNMSK